MANEIKYVGTDAIQRVITNVKGLLDDKQDTLTFDNTPTEDSVNPVKSGGVYTALAGKVDKVQGKGLSTEDYTTAEQTKLSGIETGAQVNVIESVKSGTTTFTPSSKAVDIQGVDNLINYYTKSDVYTKAETESSIASHISSVYKPAGSVAFANLPTLSASVLGNVYNVTDSFTTTSDFVEGSGKTHPAGTNVVVVDVGSSTYKFDVLAGFVDLSGYVPTSRTIAGVDLADSVTAGELRTALNVADGAEVNVQADWNQTDTSADDYIKNKPTIPTDTNQKIKTSSVTFGNDDVVQITAGTNVQVTGDATAKTITISATDTTYESKSASSGGTDVSLVTTGEKYTWDSKQDAMTEITTSEIDAMF